MVQKAKKNIVCILPQSSQYQVLHHFTIKTAEALKRAGHTVQILTVDQIMNEVSQKNPLDLTIGFNGAPQMDNGLFLCDLMNIPHAALLVDSPYYYLGLLNSPLIKIYCDDEANIELLNSLGCQSPAFFTQGVEPELIESPEVDKEYDIVFIGSYFDVELAKEAWKEHFPKELCEAMDNAVAETLRDYSLTLTKAFEDALKGRLELLKEVDISHLFYGMSYVQKAIARNNLLESLKNFHVHVWDAGWKKYPDKFNHLIIHDAVDYVASLEVLKKSKISLSNSIRSVRGCNERVLNALACGALPVTNSNPYFKQHFEDAKHLLLYSQNDLNHLAEKIAAYLSDDKLRDELIQNGKKEISLHHTWDERIKVL